MCIEGERSEALKMKGSDEQLRSSSMLVHVTDLPSS